ncbi:MAG: PspC domain-containing protein [Lachnospiraceae bacterium]|nr:PspC domain-containing protein [Lachnospiraceae bacterium]
MMNTLHRSTQNRMLAGVCGGLGEALGVDPTILRLIWAALAILTAGIPLTILYIAAGLIIPEE